jgi:hypothetical protein
MHQTLVPATFVDALLWLPTKTRDSQFVTYSEVGASSYIKCSNIAEADLAFEEVKKQRVTLLSYIFLVADCKPNFQLIYPPWPFSALEHLKPHNASPTHSTIIHWHIPFCHICSPHHGSMETDDQQQPCRHHKQG